MNILESDEKAEVEQTTSWPRVALIVFAGMVVAFQIGKVPPVLALLRAEFGFGLVASGWLISIFSLVVMTVGVAGGALADRIGPRRLMLIGLGLSAAAAGAGALATAPWWLFVTRLVEGGGFLLCVVSAPVLLLACSAPRHRRMVFGLWAVYMPAGLALAMASAGPLAASFGWRTVWGVSALLLVAGLAAAFTKLPPDRAPGTAAVGSSGTGRRDDRFAILVVRVVTSPAPVLLAATFALYTFQFMGVIGFLPYWLVELRGYDPAAASAMAAVAVLANAAGNLLGGALMMRGVGTGALVVLGSAVMAVAAFVIYPGTMADPVRFVAVIMLSLAGGMIPAALLAAVPHAAPDAATIGAANGLLVQGSHTGQIFGPPALAAWVAFAGGWSMAPLLLASAAAVAAILGVAAGHRIARKEAGRAGA
ncbi:MFS transporter [Fodinicurvata sp. EGI_FJ10296]|uniref:MFS transporter n=1 Tax=Fodinicurvata sp. EGI_FJ10296 TaxID=3231908 RepID=UPI0034530546